MKAARHTVFGNPADVVGCVDLPEPPAPGPGEVTVEMLAMSINPADLLTIEGRYGTRPTLPHVPGAEGAGRVVAIGKGVDSVQTGDLVAPMAASAWVERMTVKASAVIRLPPGMDPRQAAMIKANPATAEVMLTDIVALQPGDWLLQNAANSAVGQYVCQLARLKGIRTVNVVRRRDAVAAVAHRGGDLVLVSDGLNPEALARMVKEGVGGGAIRLALDAVGGAASNALAACLADGGALATYGLLSGRPCEVDAKHLVFRAVVHRGFWLAPWFKAAGRERIAALYEHLVRLMGEGKLAADVEATYPLSRIADAVAHAARGARGGKVLIVNES